MDKKQTPQIDPLINSENGENNSSSAHHDLFHKENKAYFEYLKNFPKKHKRSHNVVFKLENVNKIFKKGKRDIHVLKDISFDLYSGEFVIIYGPSGCGKSTLLHVMIGLEHPTTGTVEVRGKHIYRLTEDHRAIFRREKIGMVFQNSNWIRSLNVLENVAYPLILEGESEKKAYEKAFEKLKEIKIEKLADNNPVELSGGEQQRVSLARALITDPWILVADEPTGNLDSDSGLMVMEILTRLNREHHKEVILVTHDTKYVNLATRVIGLLDGKKVIDTHD